MKVKKLRKVRFYADNLLRRKDKGMKKIIILLTKTREYGRGAEVNIKMGDQPSKSWEVNSNDRPYSGFKQYHEDRS